MAREVKLSRVESVLGDLSYPATREAAASEFEDLLGSEADVLNVHRWEPGMPAYDGSWTALDRLDPPDDIAFVTNYTDRAGIIGRLTDAKGAAERLANL